MERESGRGLAPDPAAPCGSPGLTLAPRLAGGWSSGWLGLQPAALSLVLSPKMWDESPMSLT